MNRIGSKNKTTFPGAVGLASLSEPEGRALDENFSFRNFQLKNALWCPDVDVSEEKDAVVVRAELPGVDREKLEILLSGRTLTLKGRKQTETESRSETFHRIERSFGAFQRKIDLPAEVDEISAQAVFKNGVLTIVMKKTKHEYSRKITVQNGREAQE